MRLQKHFFPIILFLCLSFLIPSQATFINDTVVIDLPSSSSSQTQTDASSWTLSSTACSSCNKVFMIPSNSCGINSDKILGGPNILGPSGNSQVNQYFQRQYPVTAFDWTNLAIEFDLWMFYNSIPSSPSGTNSYSIEVDDNPERPVGISAVLQSSCETINYSGSGGVVIKAFYKFHVRVLMYHQYYNQMTVKFISTLNSPSNQVSFGLSNLVFSSDSSIPITSSISAANFPCGDNSYWIGADNNGGGCASCHSYCSVCSGASNKECDTCRVGFYNYYNRTCLNSCDGPFTPIMSSGSENHCQKACPTDFYWFSNTSCSTTCPSPLTQTTDGNGLKICSNPCYFNDNSLNKINTFLYPDKSCGATCSSPAIIWTPYLCDTPCANPNNYAFQNRSCTAGCQGPLVGSSTKGIRYCNSPCPGDYIYPSGTCETDCPSPLVKREDSADIKWCGSPCGNSYVFQNGSCTNTCVLPLLSSTVNDISYCKSPCPGDYIYPDGTTCRNDCALKKKEDSADIKYCITPCEDVNDYYFTDGTCDSTCPFPLQGKTDVGIKYCENPCTIDGTYLYDNGTCLSTCPSPNILRTKSMGKFCNFPCSNTALYFYFSDGSCQAACDYPNSAAESPLPKTCTLGLSQADVEEVKKLAGVTGTAGSVSSGGILLLTLLSSSDSTSVCMGPFSKMLSYIRFMNIVYPAKVVLMLESQANQSNTRGTTSKMIGGILDGFPENDDLPRKFIEYNAKSSFFVNFWPALFNLLAISLAISIVVLAKRWSRSYTVVNKLVKNIEEMLKWNMLLITFCGNFCDIFLFTALEFHTTKFNNIQGPISFVTCLVVNLFVMFVVIRILEVNFAVRKSRKEFVKGDVDIQEERLTKEWSSWSAFFVAYKGQSYGQQIFLFVFLARLAFFGITVGYFYQYPLAQAIMINLANVCILLYLGIKRPMKQIGSFIQQIVLEIVLLAFNLCVLILAVLDAKGIAAYEERNKIGTVIIYINLITPFLSILLMGVKFLFLGLDVYRQWKASKRNAAIKGVKRGDISLAVGTFPEKIKTRILQENKNQQIFRQFPSDIGDGNRSSALDISVNSSFNGSIINQDNSNSSFAFHQARSFIGQQQEIVPSTALLKLASHIESLVIQHNYSSPQKSIFSTEMPSMSQIPPENAESPNLRRKIGRIAKRKIPAVVSSPRLMNGDPIMKLGDE